MTPHLQAGLLEVDWENESLTLDGLLSTEPLSLFDVADAISVGSHRERVALLMRAYSAEPYLHPVIVRSKEELLAILSAPETQSRVNFVAPDTPADEATRVLSGRMELYLDESYRVADLTSTDPTPWLPMLEVEGHTVRVRETSPLHAAFNDLSRIVGFWPDWVTGILRLDWANRSISFEGLGHPAPFADTGVEYHDVLARLEHLEGECDIETEVYALCAFQEHACGLLDIHLYDSNLFRSQVLVEGLADDV